MKHKIINKVLSGVATAALILSSVGGATSALAAQPVQEPVTVTIVKYIDGEMATASSASSNSFMMSASWDATNIGSGTGQYALSPTGFNSPDPYTAVTAEMSDGAEYSTYEIMDSTVGASCGEGKPFALAGYTHGNTLQGAEDNYDSELSSSSPSFNNLQQDKYVIVWNVDCSSATTTPPTATSSVQVHINKFVNGAQATSATSSASSTSFTMNAAWDAANIGAGAGQYMLDTGNSYATETVALDSGADYATNEVLDSNVGAACSTSTTNAFALLGYTTGDTYAAAASATPSLTSPAFVDLTQDKYVIVWNQNCATATTTPPAPTATTTKVFISKFVNGAPATTATSSASSTSFLMNASWNATNIGSGTGQFTLDAGGNYMAQTVSMDAGGSYATSEVMDSNVGAVCSASTTNPFAFVGYTTGNTYAAAASATPTTTAPSFTNLSSDKYVIVWNQNCGTATTTNNGVLTVTSVEVIDGTATADGTFASGWKYLFHITAPSDEEDLQMKFSNWVSSTSSSTIPVGGNMRISSAQAASSSTVLLTAENTYSLPVLTMTGDLASSTPGRQVDVLVEVAVPVGTANGTYTTTYGVRTE